MKLAHSEISRSLSDVNAVNDSSESLMSYLWPPRSVRIREMTIRSYTSHTFETKKSCQNKIIFQDARPPSLSINLL